ncbi:hypothetical protein H0H87_005796 [Tephrocybe sp. NHM501043]|nr:hypothetical protein H0H87_005796 [Tephrocybe sp. NHM501043]
MDDQLHITTREFGSLSPSSPPNKTIPMSYQAFIDNAGLTLEDSDFSIDKSPQYFGGSAIIKPLNFIMSFNGKSIVLSLYGRLATIESFMASIDGGDPNRIDPIVDRANTTLNLIYTSPEVHDTFHNIGFVENSYAYIDFATVATRDSTFTSGTSVTVFGAQPNSKKRAQFNLDGKIFNSDFANTVIPSTHFELFSASALSDGKHILTMTFSDDSDSVYLDYILYTSSEEHSQPPPQQGTQGINTSPVTNTVATPSQTSSGPGEQSMAKGTLSHGPIIGITIGAVAAFFAFLLAFSRMRRRTFSRRKPTNERVEQFPAPTNVDMSMVVGAAQGME